MKTHCGVIFSVLKSDLKIIFLHISVCWQKWYFHTKCHACDCVANKPTSSTEFVCWLPHYELSWIVQVSTILIINTSEWDMNTSFLIESRYEECFCCSSSTQQPRNASWLSVLYPPFLCLFHFQGQCPTCSSCWVSDWLAAALHEGWVKGQGCARPCTARKPPVPIAHFWTLRLSF